MKLNDQPFLVTSHRGAGVLEPENTIRGLRRAIGLGADRIEIDVRLTSDGIAVLMHDATVDRTTNASGRVRRLSYAQISRLDAGRGEAVPRLEEALSLVRQTDTILQIELKGRRTTPGVIKLVEGLGMESQVVLTSFVQQRLVEARLLNSAIRTGVLWRQLPEDPITTAREIGARAIHVSYTAIDGPLVERAHALDLDVVAWNPNSVEEFARLANLGVDVIGSDRPDLLIDFRAGLRQGRR
jgi:glycerophosphoryl diester phosphodiesterase